MYKKMLVPLAVSELSAATLPYARELAARLEVTVVLLHVASQGERGTISKLKSEIDHRVEIVKRQAEEAKVKLGIDLKAKPVKVLGEVAIGSPAEEITRYAAENNIDLILMATHALAGIRRMIMGSVADKVVRTANVPVWLVRPGVPEETIYDQWPGKSIIVPLDGSEQAEAVLPHVASLVQQQGGEPVEVILWRSYTCPLLPPDTEYSVTLPGEYLETEIAFRRQVAENYLTQVENKIRTRGMQVRSVVVEGNAADRLIEYTKKNPSSVVVMSTHAWSGLRRSAHGSLAGSILQKAASPVVLVRITSE